jgi:hypothetical protein
MSQVSDHASGMNVENNATENNATENNVTENNVQENMINVQEDMNMSACGHAVHVDVACRKEMDEVENIIRSMARTSAITKRCQLLETCTYMNARMYILQYIANYSDPALDLAAAAPSISRDDDHGIMPKVWHLGQGISLRPSFDKNIVRVCVELQLPGSSENLPQSDAMIQLVDKKRKKNTD